MLKRQQGISLVELMVGLLLGAVALAAVSALYQTIAVHTRRQLETAHLYSLIQHVLSLIEADVRRSGYWHIRPGVDRLDDNPFQNSTNDIRAGSTPGEPENSCLLLAYDIDDDGKVGIGDCPSKHCPAWSDSDNVEQIGYRLKDGVLQFRYAGEQFSCDTGRWQALTDPGVSIVRFKVDLIAQCLDAENSTGRCGTDSTQVWSRTLALELEGQWIGQPKTRRTSRQVVQVRNDHLVSVVAAAEF